MRRFTHTVPQRISAVLLCLALCLGLLPATALAADNDTVYVGGVALTGSTSNPAYATTNDDTGEVTVLVAAPSDNQWNIKWDGNTLTLDNANIVGSYDATNNSESTGIYMSSSSGNVSLTIMLQGDNNQVSGVSGIYVFSNYGDASLSISGTGSLTAEGTGYGNYSGIMVQSSGGKAELTINNVDVTATNSNEQGIRLQPASTSLATLTVNGGSLTASGSKGIDYQFGTGTTGSGTPSLNVSNSAIVKASGDTGGITSNSSTVTPSGTGIVFNNGNGTVYGNVTLQEDLTIGEGESLTIPEGSSLDMGGHTITVESGGKLDGTPTGNGTVIDKSSPVSYLDENGAEKSCNDYEVVTANDTQWTDGWYVVNSDVTINQRISVSDDVKLILTDGRTLTVNGGIHVTGDDRFTVYGQENGNGKLTATATNNRGAGIGGNGSTTTSAGDGENGGTIIIAGGTIEAVGGDGPKDTDSPCGGAGIGNGGGPGSDDGSVTIYGGKVNATGGVANAGIGGDGSTIQILGGTVEATSGGSGAAAIGGTNGAAGTITITNSTVTAIGGDGAGIGSGWEGHGGTITITNSTVTASSKGGDSIGAGKDGTKPGTLTLSPAGGMAIAAKAGADEASALALNGSPFTAETAVTDLVRGKKYFHSEPCDIYTVTVNGSYAQTTGAGSYAKDATVTIDAGTRSGYTFDGWTSADGVTFANAGSAQTTFTMPAADTTITANWQYDPPYIPPSKPNWTSVARKLANAQPGDTVTVKMNGETEVPGEVWETIAGRDVTVILDMGGNVSWTVDGNDVPTATHFADMDFGVDRNTTGIDVDVINAITGEVSSVQITLAHDGEFGFTLTLTAPLGRENAGRWANLYHYNEDAESLSYETSGEIQEDGTASLKMTHASQYAIIIDEQTHQLPFTDVASGTWYEGAVRYAYLHDIMEGMSATTFQPNGTLTRAQAVQIFYNLEGQPDISGENLGYPYEDVDAQAWYGDAVYWARLTGVATGYGDGTFQPTDSITRQEFAQMLYNYAKYKDYDLTAEGDLSTFPDGNKVQEWAVPAMSWANGNQLINGHDDGTIDAAGIGTRAQAASILMRFDQNLVEK